MQMTYCFNCGAGLGQSAICPACEQFTRAERGVKAASIGKRIGALALDTVLFFATLVIGYVIWSLIIYQWGQTPGKQILGIRTIRTNGKPLGWGMTFVREFLVKGVLAWFASAVTFGVAWLVDDLWAAWDPDRQTIHDKIVQTVVIDERERAVSPVLPGASGVVQPAPGPTPPQRPVH